MEQKVTMDIKALVRDFGGPQALRTRYVAAGVEVPPYTSVRQWVTRNSAPGHAVAGLLKVGRDTFGSRFDPYRYIRVADPAPVEYDGADVELPPLPDLEATA